MCIRNLLLIIISILVLSNNGNALDDGRPKLVFSLNQVASKYNIVYKEQYSQLLSQRVIEDKARGEANRQATEEGLKIANQFNMRIRHDSLLFVGAALTEMDSQGLKQIEENLEIYGSVSHDPNNRNIYFEIPISKIEEISQRDEILWLFQPVLQDINAETSEVRDFPDSPYGTYSKGWNLSRADIWKNMGYDGTGIKIGIIDTDNESGGFINLADLTDPGVGELPAYLNDGQHTAGFPSAAWPGPADHGSSCAQVIHEIAPGAELFLAVTRHSSDFSEATEWLKSNGVNIISRSLGSYVGPFDGTNSISQTIESLWDDDNILFINSAGNSGEDHWSGVASDVDNNDMIEYDGTFIELLHYNHSWSDISPAKLNITLSWWNSDSYTEDDYELILYRPGASEIRSGNLGANIAAALLSYNITTNGDYYLGIRRKREDVDPNGFLKLFGIDYFNESNVAVREGSINAECNTQHCLAIGAFQLDGSDDLFEFWPYYLADYSSCGPTENDPPISKPELLSFAGVECVNSRNNFFSGTSCAAPHAAGLAALVWDRLDNDNAVTNEDVWNNLIDNDNTRYLDFQSENYCQGYGLTMLKDLGSQIGYEPNNSINEAFEPKTSRFNYVMPGERIHENFHQNGDIDYYEFMVRKVNQNSQLDPPFRVVNSVSLENREIYCNPEIQLIQLVDNNEFVLMEGNDLIQYDFNLNNEHYFIRICNTTGHYGENTGYDIAFLYDRNVSYQLTPVSIFSKPAYNPGEVINQIISIQDQSGSFINGCDVWVNVNGHSYYAAPLGSGNYQAIYYIGESGSYPVSVDVTHPKYPSAVEQTSVIVLSDEITISAELTPTSCLPGQIVNCEGLVLDDQGNGLQDLAVNIVIYPGGLALPNPPITGVDGSFSINFNAPGEPGTYSVVLSAVLNHASGELSIPLIVTDPVPGNDWGVTYFDIGSPVIPLGSTVQLQASFQNFGQFTGTNIPVVLRLRRPDGTEYDSYTEYHTLDAGYANSIAHTFSVGASQPSGDWTCEVYIDLTTDENPSNNYDSRPLWVGNYPQYYRWKLDGSIVGFSSPWSTTFSYGGYMVELKHVGSNYARFDIKRSNGSMISADENIYLNTPKLFDANQLCVLLTIADDDDNLAYINIGPHTTELTVSPIVTVGHQGENIETQLILSSTTVGNDWIYHFEGGDYHLGWPWAHSVSPSSTAHSIFTIPVGTPPGPSYQQRIGLDANDDFIYVAFCDIEILEGHNVRAHSLSLPNGTNYSIGDNVPITATIHNNGGYNEAYIPVVIEIVGSDDFIDSMGTSVSLNIDQSTTVQFNFGTSGLSGGSYSIKICTDLPQDVNSGDDCTATGQIDLAFPPTLFVNLMPSSYEYEQGSYLGVDVSVTADGEPIDDANVLLKIENPTGDTSTYPLEYTDNSYSDSISVYDVGNYEIWASAIRSGYVSGLSNKETIDVTNVFPETYIIGSSPIEGSIISSDSTRFFWQGSDAGDPTEDLVYQYALMYVDETYFLDWVSGPETMSDLTDLPESVFVFLARTVDTDGAADLTPARRQFSVRYNDLAFGEFMFNPENPVEGDIVTIQAFVIRNNNVDESYVASTVVRFWDGIPDDNQVGSDVVADFILSDTTTVSVDWNTMNEEGEHIIYCTIDPDDDITEFNENNNMISQNLSVRNQLEELIVDPLQLEITYVEGATSPVLETLHISTDGDPVDVFILSDSSWLVAESTYITTPQDVIISIDASSLDVGIHQAYVTLESIGASNSPLLINVNVNVVSEHSCQSLFVSNDGSDLSGDGSELNPFQTVQYAIDVSNTCDTIYVMPGTYNERFMILGKSPAIISTAGPASTFLTADVDRRVITIADCPDTVSIIGFDISGGVSLGDTLGDWGAGILTYNSNLKIDSCIIHDNIDDTAYTLYDGGGGIFAYNSYLSVENCEIYNNSAAYSAGGGIYFKAGSYGSIKHNYIHDNFGSFGGGIMASTGATGGDIEFNVICNNTSSNDGGGIYLFDTANMGTTYNIINNTITNNVAAYSGTGINAVMVGINGVQNVVAYNCVFEPDQAVDAGNVCLLDCGSIIWDCNNVFSEILPDSCNVPLYCGIEPIPDGNITENPLFCEESCGLENLHLSANSPCAADNPLNPCGGLIGALPVDFSCGAELDYIVIEGPDEMPETSTEQYRCHAYYTDYSDRYIDSCDVTWSHDCQPYGEIDNCGEFTTFDVSDTVSCHIYSEYAEGDITRDTVLDITIYPLDCCIDVAEVAGTTGMPVGVPVLAKCEISGVAGVEFHADYDASVILCDSLTSNIFDDPTPNCETEALHFIWDDFINPVDLSDSDTLMVLWFTCIGGIGDTGWIYCQDNIEFVDSEGEPIPDISCCDGFVYIPPCNDISGNIVYYDSVTAIPDVNIDLFGNQSGLDSTDTYGDYYFECLDPGDYTILPTRIDDDLGVSVSDIIKIRRLLAYIEPFDNAYKCIAADVNCDCRISVADVIKLRRYLAHIEDIECGNWRFIDADYIMECDEYCTDFDDYCPFPESIFVSISGQNINDADFIGIRIGDVNNTWSPTAAAKLSDALSKKLEIEDMLSSPGEIVAMPIMISDDINLAGIEMHLKYDSDQLNFMGVQSELPGEITLGSNDESIHIVWEDINRTIKASIEEPLFILTFRIEDNFKSETSVNITGAEIVDDEGRPFNLEFHHGIVSRYDFASEGSSMPKEYCLEQNRPNPFNPITEIRFSLPEPSEVSLEIFNIMGQKVKTLVEGHLDAGFHSYSWDATGYSSGIYFTRLKANVFTDTKKMILLK